MDENTILLRRLKNGEKDAESLLVEKNMGLVRSAAHRFCGASPGVDFDDLCQIGSIGLVKAIRNFDLERGLMFSTYAVPLIVGEIRKFLRDDGAVSVSRSLREKYFLIRRVTHRLSKELCREPLLSEVVEASGLSEEEVIMASDAGTAPASLDSADEDGMMLSDKIPGKDSPDIDKLALREALSRLSPDERKIVVLRYFSCKTQVQTAGLLGMTQVQISRKEKKIMDSLRMSLSQ